MSQSADPSPDPQAEPAEPANDPTPTDPQAEPAGDGGDDRVHRQAARYRTERNELQQQLEQAQAAQQETLGAIAKALGLAPEEAADPAAQVSDLTGQVSTLSSELAQARAELLVHELASEHQANPVALLDSRAFTTALHGMDPSADDYRTKVADAIKDAVTKNATLRSKGQGPARGGAPGSGQGPAQPDGAVTEEQFKAMSYREKSQLFQTNPELYRRLAGS